MTDCRRTTLLLASLVAVAACAPQALAGGSTIGSAGTGDRLLPLAGNGGYDVRAYDLRLRYVPTTRRLGGRAIIRGRATQRLTRFDLDLRGLSIGSLRVDGAPARFTRSGQELVITPARPLAAGAAFVVDVAYHGRPTAVVDPDGSSDGWQATDDGAFVASEPQGAPSWFPANDAPGDKAVFTVTMTVPRGLAAIGNGRLVRRRDATRTSTFSWRSGAPLSPYLATITIGRFRLGRQRIGAISSLVAVDPREADAARAVLDRLPAILHWEASLFGPYPFADVGAIVDHAPGVGYALETQTRPLFDRAPDSSTLVHELAHQWFGDSVTPRRWEDIWLNEGFATYVEWLWTERQGGRSAAATYAEALATHPASAVFWCVAPGALPSADQLFSDAVYDRGAMTLAALRVELGDAAFFALLRRWATAHRHGSATSADFEALAAASAGRSLDAFFAAWLRTPRRPGAAQAPGCPKLGVKALRATPRRR